MTARGAAGRLNLNGSELRLLAGRGEGGKGGKSGRGRSRARGKGKGKGKGRGKRELKQRQLKRARRSGAATGPRGQRQTPESALWNSAVSVL